MGVAPAGCKRKPANANERGRGFKSGNLSWGSPPQAANATLQMQNKSDIRLAPCAMQSCRHIILVFLSQNCSCKLALALYVESPHVTPMQLHTSDLHPRLSSAGVEITAPRPRKPHVCETAKTRELLGESACWLGIAAASFFVGERTANSSDCECDSCLCRRCFKKIDLCIY